MGLFSGHSWFGRRTAVAADGCDPGAVGVGVDAGAPATIIPGPGPAPAAPGAIQSPRPIDEAPNLQPAEPTGSGSSGSSTQGGKTTGAGRAVYETYEPRSRSLSRRDSAGRSRGMAGSSARPASPIDEVIADLPPVAAPTGDSKAPTGALPDEAKPKAEATDAPANDAAAKPAADLPPKVGEVGGGAVGAAPGIRRFRVVEPRLAGGSLPSAGGWAWLADKGYKTVLDLRERSEVRPDDLAAIDRSGLVHVALPISASSIDAPHVERFKAILEQVGSRPLYFFDTDGARASVLWYIHQVADNKVESKAAAAEAEELGPNDPKYWVAATAYLASLKPVAPPVDPAPPASPAPDAPATQPKAAVDAGASASAPVPPPAAAPEELPGPAPAPSETMAWRPYAAMVLTGLSVPLAFYGRSAFILGRSARASLPAPGRSPSALPPASGA
jgi:protein tyrosine phosphatase (PTP) superfamily phosphohydrolase (DUF442 family)